MDPEVIAQLEEQLRLMTEMLVQQNRTMASKIDSTTTSLNSSLSGLNRSLGSSTRATTKYEEAVNKASEKTTESADRWNKALGGSVSTVNNLSTAFEKGSNVLGTFAGALLSTEKGFSKYGATVEGATGAVTSFASSIPLVGTTLGAASRLVSGVFTKLVGDGLKLADAIVTLRDETVKTAGAMPVTSEGLLQLANNAKYFGENIQVLGKITQGLGTGLVTLGNTAGQGAVKFMELANVSEETRQAFGKMGISQEELTQMQATYIKQQQSSGLAYLSQNKSIDQLRRESLKYAENLNALSSLTGKQADSLRAEQDIAAAVMQEKVAQRQDMIELKRLKDAGLTAEAADLEAKIKSMASYRDTMANLVGPEQTAQYMNYMRTGVFNNISAPLAVLGVDLEKARTQLVSGVDGMEVAAQSANNLREAQDSQLSNLGQAALHLQDDVLSGLGQNKEALTRLSDTYGKSYEEMLTAAKKDQEARKQGSPIDNTIEQVRATERMLQQRYQEFLMDGIKKAAALVEQVDLTKEASKILNSVVSNLEGGLTKAALVLGGVVVGLGILKGISVATALSARKAQEDFTKALRDSSDALRKQYRASGSATSADIKEAEASRNARAADLAEARASSSATSADKAETRASDLSKAADTREARASDSSAQADRTEAAASRRAAAADMREASASQQAAAADIREAAESMKAAAADIRESRASDAAAAADRRESMSGGDGNFGMLGKAGRLLGKLAPWATAGMLAYDAVEGFTADPNASLVDKLKNAGSSALSGVSFGLLGTSPAEIAEKSAKESLSESNNESLVNQLAILNSASSTGGVASMTPEQLAAYGISPEAAPVVAQEPDTAEKEKAAQDKSATPTGYTIQKGDTLSQLAKIHGISLESLLEANQQITNKDLIYEGNKLILPGVVSGIPGTEVMDPEEIEKVQADVLRRNREANEEVIEQNKISDKLLETTIKYDTTLSATNDALTKFKDLIISLNSVLGEINTGDGSTTPGSGFGAAPADLSSYMAATAMVESGGKANAKASTSSASGIFQFIKGTWQDTVRAMGKDYSLADRFDPQKSAEVMAYFTQQNKNQLERSIGRPASNTDLYMAHFMGVGGAANFLKSLDKNPNAIAADMYPAAAKANKNIYYDSGNPRTLRQVYDLMHNKMNNASQLIAQGKAPSFVQEMASGGSKGMPYAERGGIFKGPDSGYLAMLHGKEAVVPLDNKFTRSQARMQSSDRFTVNGKPIDQKAYDSFMKDNPELQDIKQKVQSMLGAVNNDRIDPTKMIGSMSQLIDSNLTGVKDEIIDKNKKIQDSLIQMVSRETTKALQSMNETNQPMQNAAMEITRSMKSVMNAHTESMNELTYKLGRMIDVLEAGNDVSKKILKKASA
jgi:LysM repeat protein